MTTSGVAAGAEEVVLYREEGALAYITLNRPQKLNALHPEVFRLLGEDLDRFSTSPGAKVAILHGNGTLSSNYQARPGQVPACPMQ